MTEDMDLDVVQKTVKDLDIDTSAFDYIIFADGSGTTLENFSFWVAVVYGVSKETVDVINGHSSVGTNNYAELMAILNPLWYVSKLQAGPRVLVLSDSEVTVKCGNEQYAPSANLLFWRAMGAFKEVSIPVEFRHVRRNSNPVNAYCDGVCRELRKLFAPGI